MNPKVNFRLQIIYQYSFINSNKCIAPMLDVNNSRNLADGGRVYGNYCHQFSYKFKTALRNKANQFKNL